MESQYLIAKGQVPNLSEQIVISCSGAGSCNGGSTYQAAVFLRNRGTSLEICYEDTGTNGDCNKGPCSYWQNYPHNFKIDDVSYVTWGDIPTVSQLKNALYENGPLVASMVTYRDFFRYKSGVYEYTWGWESIDDLIEGGSGHAVLLIGWNDYEQAFICKNSWGTDWGESGFFKIAYSELNGKSRFARGSLALHLKECRRDVIYTDGWEYDDSYLYLRETCYTPEPDRKIRSIAWYVRNGGLYEYQYNSYEGNTISIYTYVAPWADNKHPTYKTTINASSWTVSNRIMCANIFEPCSAENPLGVPLKIDTNTFYAYPQNYYKKSTFIGQCLPLIWGQNVYGPSPICWGQK